jgi:hypothetical protein
VLAFLLAKCITVTLTSRDWIVDAQNRQLALALKITEATSL